MKGFKYIPLYRLFLWSDPEYAFGWLGSNYYIHLKNVVVLVGVPLAEHGAGKQQVSYFPRTGKRLSFPTERKALKRVLY